MSTELDEAVAYLQFHISFYDRAAETPPRTATASKTVLQALASAEHEAREWKMHAHKETDAWRSENRKRKDEEDRSEAAEARLKAVEDVLALLDDLGADLPQHSTQTAPEAYWEGSKDAREYLFARIRTVLKEKP